MAYGELVFFSWSSVVNVCVIRTLCVQWPDWASASWAAPSQWSTSCLTLWVPGRSASSEIHSITSLRQVSLLISKQSRSTERSRWSNRFYCFANITSRSLACFFWKLMEKKKCFCRMEMSKWLIWRCCVCSSDDSGFDSSAHVLGCGVLWRLWEEQMVGHRCGCGSSPAGRRSGEC